MNRKDFLRGAGLAGLGIALPGSNLRSSPIRPLPVGTDCVLIPSETAGPFPLDLTENTMFFRQDVRESEEGVQLNVRLRIIGLDNCEPMQNVRVNIWHCNKDGLYSGYSVIGNQGQAGLTYLRGYQFADANGEVEFISNLPGWYTGRICHIHFQVHVSSMYSAVSQLTFPIAEKNAIYLANASLYTKGVDPLDYAQDNVFADGHDYQLATLEENTSTGGYNTFLQVAVEGSGTTGVGHLEKEIAKVFELGQNYPNPYRATTVIPVAILQPADVTLELWDLSGKRVATVVQEHRSVGELLIEVSPTKLGLPNGNYVYQLEAKTATGATFRLPKMMTVLR